MNLSYYKWSPKEENRSSTLLFLKKWASYRLYRKRPPRIVNRTIPKIIVISVHTVNRFPLKLNLLRGHLSYKATFSLSQRWPLNTGLTVLQNMHSNKFIRIKQAIKNKNNLFPRLQGPKRTYKSDIMIAIIWHKTQYKTNLAREYNIYLRNYI